jgi:hypothetical protein
VPIAFLLNLLSLTFAQDESDKDADRRGATIRGKIVPDEKFPIEWGDLEIKLFQQVELPQPPLPDNFQSMAASEREEWWKKLLQTEEGKQLQAERQRLIEAADVFEIEIEQNGSFVVYDVPEGRYGLRGRLDKSIGQTNYAFEVFGQVDVLKGVDEVLLDPIRISVTPILKPGQSTPSVKLESLDGKRQIVNSDLKGMYVLINFWSVDSPPSLQFLPVVQDAIAKLKPQLEITLLSIHVGTKQQEGLDYVQVKQVAGLHGYAESWDHDVVTGFGIRGIPALFLLSPGEKM